MTRSLAPRATHIPDGTMSGPLHAPVTLLTGGSQIWHAGRWRTVREVAACPIGHGDQCAWIRLAGRTSLHLHMSTERIIRHPVEVTT